ncbi:MAG: hypothetical protein JWP37_42 [Mucilaginibacter sp.]|nr:hypothetical protein [Mucilaginibacter sp.]
MILVAVILFSASMVVPVFRDSKWKDWMQGAAIGLMFAGIISVISALVDYLKLNKTVK